MSLSFSTPLSGLKASSNALGVTGNNIANANTVGYKSQSISFASLFFSSLNNAGGLPLQVGDGVTTSLISRDFSQGNVTGSNTPTNLAIQGNGYFVVRDSNGIQSYTRAGNFTLDKDGFLTTPTGEKVQGYSAVNGVVPSDAALEALKIPIGSTLAPQVTSEVSLKANLNAADPVGTKFTTSVQVFDSLGVAHTLNLTYEKTANQEYTVTADLDGDPAMASSNTLMFDSNGNLTSPAAPGQIAITPDQSKLNGATLPSINISLYQPDGTANISNFAANSSVSSTNQNGFAAGTINGLAIDNTGTLVATFTNGQTKPIGQVALALFNSQDGLKNASNNLYIETLASGPASVGRPATGGRGAVIGNALEQSNVDIATEFTNLIVAQRSFQANSKVITTFNQTLQDLLQII
ncbi:MAG: flagellar hook protein FlgE [Blastocatellia bacterium]